MVLCCELADYSCLLIIKYCHFRAMTDWSEPEDPTYVIDDTPAGISHGPGLLQRGSSSNPQPTLLKEMRNIEIIYTEIIARLHKNESQLMDIMKMMIEL